MEPSSAYEINWTTGVINWVLLYSFTAASLIIPDYINVAQRGFFCNDDSIRYPYHPDTISDFVLVAYNLALNIVIILVVESYRMFKAQSSISYPKDRWRKSDFYAILVRFVIFFGYSQIGFIMNLALFMATKDMVGRLRPHFLDVCKLANDTCAIAENQHRYIIDYECTGDPALILRGRKSFYSGHAALSIYCAVWSILYMQARFSNLLNNSVFVPIIQTLIIIGAFAISFSRITDNQHHWSDVSVGLFIGIVIAIYTCIYWSDIFKNNGIEDDSQVESKPDDSPQLKINCVETN